MNGIYKEQALHDVVELIRECQSNLNRPILVAIDGGSGAGKSTLAATIAEQFDAAIIPLDDFFSAHIPDQQWQPSLPRNAYSTSSIGKG